MPISVVIVIALMMPLPMPISVVIAIRLVIAGLGVPTMAPMPPISVVIAIALLMPLPMPISVVIAIRLVIAPLTLLHLPVMRFASGLPAVGIGQGPWPLRTRLRQQGGGAHPTGWNGDLRQL